MRLLDLLRRLSRGAGATAPTNAMPSDSLGHGWGFAWPTDRRILYNRAPRVPTASPGASARSWSGGTRRRSEWTGHDVPDFDKEKPPDYRPPRTARRATTRIAGDQPFILHPDGVGWLWVASGLKDGPLPAHYEPLESPVGNPLYPEQPTNPAADRKQRPDNRTRSRRAIRASHTC